MVQASEDPIIVKHGRRSVTFAPWGGEIEARLRSGRFYEQEFLRYIEALGLGGAYVDAGACVGTHTIFFALFCQPTHVHAFEASPALARVLGTNVAANSVGDSVTIHPLGLSDRTENVRIRFESNDDLVACRRLDEVVTEQVSLIKIDVEGMEPKVLAGARRLLERDRPVIFFEAHTPELLAACLAPLEPLGYVPTGRVFNASPTYEVASRVSRTVPLDTLPLARPLGDEGWRPDNGAWLPVTSGKVHFLQLTGAVDGNVRVQLEQRGASAEVASTSYGLVERFFRPLPLDPETKAVRVVLEAEAGGVFELGTSALHVQR